MLSAAHRWLSVVTIALVLSGYPALAGERQGLRPMSDDGVWTAADRAGLAVVGREVWISPDKFEAFDVDLAALGDVLNQAPLELTIEAGAFQPEIHLPMPNGEFARFRFVESPIMEPGLAAKFPEIKTYLGQGIDDPGATVRFDITPAGFHAQIFSPSGRVMIDPQFKGDATRHVSYFARDYTNIPIGWQCFFKGEIQEGAAPGVDDTGDALRIGETLRTYRLAVAATGEYTGFHGGTVAAGQAAIVTAVNRINQVYEADLAVRMVLVANNDQIVFTNAATDPYTNDNGFTMLGQNQSEIDSTIGNANYDIGHVFSTGGGGVASLGVVCRTNNKARGVTGLPSPTGDIFYIDFVAHEVGHQFGGNHTFNGLRGNCAGGNRSGAHAYSPGSGSTVMAYAGICADVNGNDNLQSNSDPFFHHESIREIRNYVTTGSGGNCDATSATGNTDPTVNAGPNFTIPSRTPFELTATGSDPDSDPVTYSWEERDLGPQAQLTAPDDGQIPLWRPWPPVSIPTRIFPRLSNLVNNTFPKGEQQATTSRSMVFRVTIRDNVAGGGGTDFDNMTVTTTAAAGPFVVTSPNIGTEVWASTGDVTWTVASTDLAPVNAANVDILLSTDGGLTYPMTLLSNTPNDGSATVVVPPGNQTTAARIRVQGSNNIFFDISNQNFELGPQGPLAIVLPNGPPTSMAPGVAVNFDVEITDLEETLVPASPTLHYRYDGGSFLTVALTSLGGISYQATLPAAGCSDTPEFYVSALGNGGGSVTEPGNAPTTSFPAVVGELALTLTESFDAGEGSFVYADGTFRGTEDPDAFADGVFDPAGGQSGGGLHLTLGPQSTEMSGGWTIDFEVTAGSGDIQVDLSYRLLMAGVYEPGEIAEALVSVDGILVGLNGNDYLTRFEGDGNVPDTDLDTLWRDESLVINGLAIGMHQLVVGGYNNASSFSNEITDVFFDNVTISQFECVALPAEAVAARSCAQHDCDRLCLDLDVPPGSGGSNVESRVTLGSDIEIDFAAGTAPASPIVASVDCTDLGGAVTSHLASVNTVSAAGDTVNVTFSPPLPDQNACVITLDGGASVCIRMLQGDINRNGSVTTGDFSEVRFWFNQTACVAGANVDYNTVNGITTGDASGVRFFFNNTTPACP